MFSLHKYSLNCNQIFSSSLFVELPKRNEVINMKLKGWPFKPMDGTINPLEIGGGAGPGNPD